MSTRKHKSLRHIASKSAIQHIKTGDMVRFVDDSPSPLGTKPILRLGQDYPVISVGKTVIGVLISTGGCHHARYYANRFKKVS